MRGVVHHRENGAQEWNRHKENEREREMLPTPYLLILGGMFSGFQAIWPPRVAVLFQFGRALLRNQRALSGKPMFWQPYRCTTPGCWPRGIAGVMDLLSAGGTT